MGRRHLFIVCDCHQIFKLQANRELGTESLRCRGELGKAPLHKNMLLLLNEEVKVLSVDLHVLIDLVIDSQLLTHGEPLLSPNPEGQMRLVAVGENCSQTLEQGCYVLPLSPC